MSDPLGPARGIIIGLLVGLVLWLVWFGVVRL